MIELKSILKENKDMSGVMIEFNLKLGERQQKEKWFNVFYNL